VAIVDHFRQFCIQGRLSDVYVPQDSFGRRQGYAYVTFETEVDLLNSLQVFSDAYRSSLSGETSWKLITVFSLHNPLQAIVGSESPLSVARFLRGVLGPAGLFLFLLALD